MATLRSVGEAAEVQDVHVLTLNRGAGGPPRLRRRVADDEHTLQAKTLPQCLAAGCGDAQNVVGARERSADESAAERPEPGPECVNVARAGMDLEEDGL